MKYVLQNKEKYLCFIKRIVIKENDKTESLLYQEIICL